MQYLFNLDFSIHCTVSAESLEEPLGGGKKGRVWQGKEQEVLGGFGLFCFVFFLNKHTSL